MTTKLRQSALAEMPAEQEPVGIIRADGTGWFVEWYVSIVELGVDRPLYTSPQPAKQMLTEGEIDRSDAVNLARNLMDPRIQSAITAKGVIVLRDAVLAMDAKLNQINHQ